MRMTKPRRRTEQRYSLDQFASDLAGQFLLYGGHGYPVVGNGPTGGGERIEGHFEGMVRGALKRNGVVFAAITARMLLFSEVELRFQNLSDRKVFGTPALGPLEAPAPNRTTGEVLAGLEVDASLCGNGFVVRRTGNQGRPLLRRLRPDWVEILTMGDPHDPDSEVVGYSYTPGGPASGKDPQTFLVEDVAHYSPLPDPEACWRGMSWLTPILREIEADSGFTDHRRKFIDNAAIVPYALTYPEMSAERFGKVVEAWRSQHEGAGNSWKAVHLAGGADVKPLGVNLKDLDFKSVQGGGETRIASASRVPATVLGISEGLAGSSLNAGNYGMARRQFGDGFAHPHWRIVAGALAKMVTVPTGARLWYDASQVSFLREDHKDAAEVLEKQAAAMRQLVDGGFEPKSVVAAVTNGDLSQLQHSGKLSVQLQLPGTESKSNGSSAPVGAGKVA